MPTKVVATAVGGEADGRSVELVYGELRVIGSGSFGTVYQATMTIPGPPEKIAIKKVLQDKRYKNRELEMMQKLRHPNIVSLRFFHYSSEKRKNSSAHSNADNELFLNLILEFLPETAYRVARDATKRRQQLPNIAIQLYAYQLFRALHYVHQKGICHRDIKPQNLLLNSETGVLKLCDFGSAKALKPGESNVSYICSRYYRAPELIFGAAQYTTTIDVWSAGCVLAELLLGSPLFPGDSAVDQLVEIIKILGTPTRDQILAMNPHYTDFKFPAVRPNPWHKIFPTATPADALNLVRDLLLYSPATRPSPALVCAHPFFQPLRNPGTRWTNNRPLPPILFSAAELAGLSPALAATLGSPPANNRSLTLPANNTTTTTTTTTTKSTDPKR